MKKLVALFLFSLAWISSEAQNSDELLPKVSHAEPIYVDLIRDLGARKGERELNIGMGMASHTSITQYSFLIEYEFAPINRLGLELELPVSFSTQGISETAERNTNGLEGIKAAIQYSFFVSEKYNTTFALGYMFESRMTNLHPRYSHTPFFIAAKRWGRQFHSLLYMGPQYESDKTHRLTTTALINASIHYMLPGTKNFIGMEVNDEWRDARNMIMLRPQLKMTISSTSAIGVALGIPANDSQLYHDFLIRWVYEPARKK